MIWKLSAKVCTRYSIFDLYITAHVTTLRILNRFIQINFSVGCMVWPWCWLFQDRLPVKILIRWTYSKSIVGAGFVVRLFSLSQVNNILTTFFQTPKHFSYFESNAMPVARQCQLLLFFFSSALPYLLSKKQEPVN